MWLGVVGCDHCCTSVCSGHAAFNTAIDMLDNDTTIGGEGVWLGLGGVC